MTEVVHQTAPEKSYNEPVIKLKGQKLHVLDKLTCLGSTLSRAVHTDDEENQMTAKSIATFGRQYRNVWDRSGIRLNRKETFYSI